MEADKFWCSINDDIALTLNRYRSVIPFCPMQSVSVESTIQIFQQFLKFWDAINAHFGVKSLVFLRKNNLIPAWLALSEKSRFLYPKIPNKLLLVNDLIAQPINITSLRRHKISLHCNSQLAIPLQSYCDENLFN